MNANLDYLNIVECTNIYRNLNPTELIEFAIKRGEGILAENGALVVNTGKYTGRSPKDRFIVKDEITENTVNWNDVTQTVTSTKGDISIKLTIGSNKLYVNEKEIVLDVPAQLINSRTFVPVRAVAEAFMCNVDWDDQNKTVIIKN